MTRPDENDRRLAGGMAAAARAEITRVEHQIKALQAYIDALAALVEPATPATPAEGSDERR